MEDYLLILGFFLLYISGCFYFFKFIERILFKFNYYLKLLIQSFFYALFYGFGALGQGGNPGFAIPFPLFLIAFFDIWNNVQYKYILTGFSKPILFWWSLIFLILLLINFLKIDPLQKKKIG